MMNRTENLARLLYGSVKRYFLAMKPREKTALSSAADASDRFWRMVEPSAPDIIATCEDEEAREALRHRYYGFVLLLYDEVCPHEDARQMSEWTRYRPKSREEISVKTYEGKYDDLVQWVSERLGENTKAKDKGMIARLKRADRSANLAVQAWELLIRFNVEDRDFSPCLAVLAPMCRRDDPEDGTASLGRALASCFDNGDKGRSRLYRLLNCDDMEELCRLLRHILSLIDSKKKEKISYRRLLDEVLAFRHPDRRQYIKRRWSTDYWLSYKTADPEPDGENA